jgi:DNA-binding NarL/FixJ family response regulator
VVLCLLSCLLNQTQPLLHCHQVTEQVSRCRRREKSLSERNESMKVFLVDDSAIVLEKLAAMISGIDGVEIAGQAMNARDAIQSIVKLKPDVAILDIRLNGGGSGMEVLKRIKKENPPPIVIMLTNHPYPQYREKCQALGADYFFDKVT